MTVLWCKMDLQEDWEPSPPPEYNLEINASKRSSEKGREAPRYLYHPDVANIANLHPHPHPHSPGWGGGQPHGSGGGDIPNSMVYHSSYDEKKVEIDEV